MELGAVRGEGGGGSWRAPPCPLPPAQPTLCSPGPMGHPVSSHPSAPAEHGQIIFLSRLSSSATTWAPRFLLSFEPGLGVNPSRQVMIGAPPLIPKSLVPPQLASDIGFPLLRTEGHMTTAARTPLGSQLSEEWQSKGSPSPTNIRYSFSGPSRWASRLSLNQETDSNAVPR